MTTNDATLPDPVLPEALGTLTLLGVDLRALCRPEADRLAASVRVIPLVPAEARLIVGLALYAEGHHHGEKAMGVLAASISETAGVHLGTLRRWRAQVEQEYVLPPATTRAELRAPARSRSERSPAPQGADAADGPVETTSRPAVTAMAVSEGTTPPAPASSVLPGAASLEPSGDLIADAKTLLRFMRAVAPKRLAAANLRDEHYEEVAAWARAFVAAPRQGSAPAKEPTGKCLHPVTRRMGPQCGLCGEKVGGK